MDTMTPVATNNGPARRPTLGRGDSGCHPGSDFARGGPLIAPPRAVRPAHDAANPTAPRWRALHAPTAIHPEIPPSDSHTPAKPPVDARPLSCEGHPS